MRIPLPNDWASVTDAVSAGPTLVRDGKPIFNAGEALTPVQLHGRDPRTAIGQKADGSIVMVAVDGRRTGWSIGITNWDLAQTLVRDGCVTGFALDSGGSTTIAFDGKVLNRPSDSYGERPVGEALVIAYTGVYVPPVGATLSPNADGVADVEALTYKLVRPSTVSVKLIAPDGSARELDVGPKAQGRYPAVVIIPGIYGVSDYMRETAAQLAQNGFVGLTVNTFSRHVAPSSRRARSIRSAGRASANGRPSRWANWARSRSTWRRVCEPVGSATAGPPPLYGTCTRSMPVLSLSSSPAMCEGVPFPAEA